MRLMKRIFSGVQPSGNLHIGNYLGAIKNWVRLQNEYDSIFCIVDLHAITVPQDPKELQRKILEVAKIYLASGIDPKKSTIFIQSHVPEHAEITWILNTIAKVAELERMTQFKDKSQKQGLGVGLFNYPVLMASDILLYDTNLVPVGEDQLQHIEIARTLAKRFNQKFGETFIVPEGYVTKESMRIMGLDNPKSKMSKSASSEYNYIGILDNPDTIKRKIKKAVTDSGKKIKYSCEKPALKNLINIYSAFSSKTPQDVEKKYENKGYAGFKEDLAEVVVKSLEPIQKEYNSLNDNEVRKILDDGAKRAKKIAGKKMEEVRRKVGLA